MWHQADEVRRASNNSRGMLMEAVPNVSEGRRADVLAALMAAGAGEDAHLLNVSSDPSHNRTVLTLAGTPAGLHEAMLALVAAAIARIDLAEHQGVHPRLGAVDVMPFVPLSGSTMADAVALAKRFACAAADTFGIPVYLYEEAAPAAHRQRLDQIRAGGLAGLAARMALPDWWPDAGPRTPHLTAGVMAVGARPPLVAFNVNLDTTDMAIATRIASEVRARNGGLPGVKALPMWLAHRSLAQVSMNLVDLDRTTAADAFAAVAHAAGTLGVTVVDSEVVGLIPRAALGGRLPRELQIADWTDALLLEEQLRRAGLT